MSPVNFCEVEPVSVASLKNYYGRVCLYLVGKSHYLCLDNHDGMKSAPVSDEFAAAFMKEFGESIPNCLCGHSWAEHSPGGESCQAQDFECECFEYAKPETTS